MKIYILLIQNYAHFIFSIEKVNKNDLVFVPRTGGKPNQVIRSKKTIKQPKLNHSNY